MSTSFTTTFDAIRKGDLLPTFDAQLFEFGSPFDLTAATNIAMVWKNQTTGISSTGVASATNALNGKVSYAWMSGDTTNAGTYSVEFVVTMPSSKLITFPNSGVQTFQITQF